MGVGFEVFATLVVLNNGLHQPKRNEHHVRLFVGPLVGAGRVLLDINDGRHPIRREYHLDRWRFGIFLWEL